MAGKAINQSYSLRDYMVYSIFLMFLVSILFLIQHEIAIGSFKPSFEGFKHYTIDKADTLLRFTMHPNSSISENNQDRKFKQQQPQLPTLRVDDDDSKVIKRESRGQLKCNGKYVDSEVIYWKINPNDYYYESPITPHHGDHHDKFLTFQYDFGGWNNMRMSFECISVVAHATGRTLVLPPEQSLYLLSKLHKDKDKVKAHTQMQLEDFYDFNLIKQQKGFHIMSMEEFLEREGKSGDLKGIYPPGNSSQIMGPKLWNYLSKVTYKFSISINYLSESF